jgi:spore coat protein U-like protein
MDARPAFAALGIAAAFAPVPALAEQASATMRVSLTVRPACKVEASPLAFDGFEGSAIEAESRIAVSCNTDTAVSVALDTGTNGAGAQRRLSGASGHVPYAIYADAARRLPWDAQTPVGAAVAGGALQLVAYGRVEPGATDGAVGSFTDTVTVTVDF